MTKPKLINFAPVQDILATTAENPWEPLSFDYIPYTVIAPPEGYLFTCGSGVANYASFATTSAQGFTYVSAIDVFRNDWDRNGNLLVDVDRYLAGLPVNGSVPVYQSPKDWYPYHHLKLDDDLLKLKVIKPQWKIYLEKNLEKGI